MNLVAGKAEAKGLRITTGAAPGLPPVLRGDAHRLRQILANFAANAVKFTERGSVFLNALPAGLRGDRILVRFEVQDSGIGIAARDRDRLFRPFEQVDGSEARRFGGSGLGLAINRGLTHLMGGEIGVDSEPGRGSTFWVTVPLARGQETRPAPAKDGGDARLPPRTRVLVAEDNPVNQEVVLATLRDAGVAADLAENGAEAVAMAGRMDYDLILMDMQMPVMDGLEATRVLRATPRNARTCIIAMTANAFDEDRRRCLAAGMDGYLAKPVAPDDLVAAMMRWIPAKPGPAVPGAPPALAPAAETAALDRLEALLAADDMAATRACRELAPHLRACLGDRVDSFERQVGAFDFQAALATLRAARRTAAADT